MFHLIPVSGKDLREGQGWHFLWRCNMDNSAKPTRRTVQLYILPVITVCPRNCVLRHEGHKMILIIHRSVFLGRPQRRRRRKNILNMDAKNARQNKQTASSCGESLELKQRRLICVEANVTHLVFLVPLSFFNSRPPCSHCHLLSPYMWLPTPDFKRCLASSLTDCLICSLIVSEMQQRFRGSLLWGWMWISLPVRQAREVEKEAGLFHAQQEGRVEKQRIGGREVKSFTKELPF